MYVIDVPSIPPSLNLTLRMDWRKRNRIKTQWMQEFFLFPADQRSQLRKWAETGARMFVRITVYHARLYDECDNLRGACKPIFDALRDSRFIFDDKPLYLESEVNQEKCSHKTRHTMIEIGLCSKSPCKQEE